MRDKYTVKGQVAAIGPNSKAENNTFNQLSIASTDEFDLDALSKELDALIEAVKGTTQVAEHPQSLEILKEAQVAAQNGERARVFLELAKVGQWVLETAKEIGVEVAAAAIVKSTGLES